MKASLLLPKRPDLRRQPTGSQGWRRGSGYRFCGHAQQAQRCSASELSAQLNALHQQLAASDAQKTSLEASLQEQQKAAADLQAKLDSATTAKSEANKSSRQARLISPSCRSKWRTGRISCKQRCPKESKKAKARCPVGRIAGVGVVAAGIAAALAHGEEQDAKVKDANEQMAALQEQLNAVNAEKSDLQAKLEEQEKAIADLQTQRDELAQNLHARWEAAADLQAQLDSTAAAKSAGEEKLQASEAELAGLKEQLASWQSDLHSALPEDARPAEAAAVVEDQAAKEGSAAGPAVTAGAVAAGIAALVALSKQRDAELTQLAEKNATLEAQVHAAGAKGPAAPAIPIAYAVLQAPKTIVIKLGPTPTENIYGRVYVPGLTDEAGDPDGISAEVGVFGAQGSDPTTWSTWQPLVYNAYCDACGHNYEYMGKLNPDVAGHFYSWSVFPMTADGTGFMATRIARTAANRAWWLSIPVQYVVAGEREEVGAAVALGPEPVTEAPQPEAPPAESSVGTEPPEAGAEAEPADAAVAESPEAVLPEPEAQCRRCSRGSRARRSRTC